MEQRIDDEVKGTEVEPRSPAPRARRSGRDVLFRISAWHVAAVAALFAVLLVVLFLFPGYSELIFGLAWAVVGVGRLVAVHLEAREDDALPPASPEFRRLADPRRPLTAGDPVSNAPERLPVAAGRIDPPASIPR